MPDMAGRYVQPEKPKAEAPAPEPVKAVEKAQPKKSEPKAEPAKAAKVEAKKDDKKDGKKKKSNGFKLFGAQVLTAGAIGGLGYAVATKGEKLAELERKADKALMKLGPLKE